MAPMRRLPLVLALLGSLLAAGCAEPTPDVDDGLPDDSDNTTPPGSSAPNPSAPTPDGDDDPAGNGQTVQFRELATGRSSELRYPVRLIFTAQPEFDTFWREHHKQSFDGATGEPIPPPPAPRVDFDNERAVAITLGDMPDTCRHVRVTGAALDGGITTLTVTTYGPAEGMACGTMITQPYVMIAIPNDGTEVAYRDESARGNPRN